MAMDMNVALKITAGVTGQQSIDQLRSSLDKLNGSADTVGKAFGLAKTAVGAFIGIESASQLIAFARGTINAADALNDMSQRTGIAASTLSELDYAAKMNGSSIEALQSVMSKLSAKAVDAATGSKTAAVAFDVLGVSVRNSDGTMKSSVTLLEEIGDAFRDIRDPTVKSALAIEMFGKSGVQMIPVIEGMREARDEAKQLGITVGDDFAASAAAFNDNMDRMAGMASALSKSLLNELLPSLNRVMDAMVQARKEGESSAWAGLRQVTRNAVYDYDNLNTSIAEVTEKIARLEEMQKALSKDSFAATVNRFFSPEDLATVNNQLAEARAVLQQMKDLRGDSKIGGGRGVVNPPTVVSGKTDLARLGAAKAEEEATKAANRVAEERARILQSLNDEVVRLVQGEDQLTIAKLRALGASDREIAQAQQLLRQKAQQRSLDEQLDEATREETRNREEAARAQERLVEAGRRVYEETRTPLEKLAERESYLQTLLDKGVIKWDEYSRGIMQAREAYDELGKKGDDTMKELKDAVEGWGRQATDAFVEFAFTGKSSFKDMVNSILQDIARMMVQQMIMKPIMNAIGGMFGFANGGIMTDAGAVPLKKYANGGIANSPQLALFGEGRMPEAYVPLPDGRTIPVTMKGDAGGSTSVVVNVNVESGQTKVESDQGAGNLGRLIAGAVKAELINQKRPGGLLAA